MRPIRIQRNKWWLAIGLVAIIALGLASRRFPSLFPAMLGKYPGDALWALMVFVGWAALQPRASTRHLAALAFSTSCIVEFSQLYQAPWINSIRGTTLGHLVLGSTFSWLDIAAYAVGIVMGVSIDSTLHGAASLMAGQRLTSRSAKPSSTAR